MKIDLDIDPIAVSKTLIKFIQDQVQKAGLAHAVVNLSGGLDSAVACALTVEALGVQNVLALRLPYRTSSSGSLEHAQLLIDQLSIPSRTIEITPMVDAFLAVDPEMSPVRKGNLMARTRMIIGYDQSAAIKGLVVGTGNKTEILLGYTTLYGDSACAFNPIGDLYKTQVRQLARSLNIPEPILLKAPSADLWAGQTDEKELGFTYENVDRLLYLLVEEQIPPEKCVQAGFSEEFIRQVLKRVHQNDFKRNLPLIASLTRTTVGMGYRNPPAWQTG